MEVTLDNVAHELLEQRTVGVRRGGGRGNDYYAYSTVLLTSEAELLLSSRAHFWRSSAETRTAAPCGPGRSCGTGL